MSVAGVLTKRTHAENYFLMHPDSRDISVVGSEVTFPALFDYTYATNNLDGRNVEQQKRVPHLTFFSAHAGLLTPRVTKLQVGSAIFTVYRVLDDKTEETFQAEAWLV